MDQVQTIHQGVRWREQHELVRCTSWYTLRHLDSERVSTNEERFQGDIMRDDVLNGAVEHASSCYALGVTGKPRSARRTRC